MSGRDDVWDAALSAWARRRGDLRALVQIGSRVQEGAAVDAWSDHDYQLITSQPKIYRDGSFCRDLGACWAYGSHVAFGDSVKVTAVYDGALEADFVILRHIEVVVAMLAMRWPGTEAWWPLKLRRGVANLRIVAAPGWRVLKGGALWERRYSRIAPLRSPLGQDEYDRLCGNFWTQAVWAAKKAQRGEFRASQRCFHEHLVESSLRLLQEEATLEGRLAYPLGRRAELWLSEEQLRATAEGTRPDRRSLITALVEISGLFEGSSVAVARKRGWVKRDFSAVRAWLSDQAADFK